MADGVTDGRNDASQTAEWRASSVSTTVREAAAIGTSLNVALMMTARLPKDPHISLARS